MSKKQQTYTAAWDELTRLCADLENEDITVDELSEKVKRAAQLIAFCKNKLRNTEEEVSRILEEMQGNGEE